MKKTFITLSCLALAASTTYADIGWSGGGTTEVFLDPNGGNVQAGSLVQLIRRSLGDPMTDSVVGVAQIIDGGAFGGPTVFNGGVSPSAANQSFYVRVWNGATEATSTWFGDSIQNVSVATDVAPNTGAGLWTDTGDVGGVNPPNSSHNFGSWNLNQSVGVVPEPGTLALFGAGLAGLLLMRRRKI